MIVCTCLYFQTCAYRVHLNTSDIFEHVLVCMYCVYCRNWPSWTITMLRIGRVVSYFLLVGLLAVLVKTESYSPRSSRCSRLCHCYYQSLFCRGYQYSSIPSDVGADVQNIDFQVLLRYLLFFTEFNLVCLYTYLLTTFS